MDVLSNFAVIDVVVVQTWDLESCVNPVDMSVDKCCQHGDRMGQLLLCVQVENSHPKSTVVSCIQEFVNCHWACAIAPDGMRTGWHSFDARDPVLVAMLCRTHLTTKNERTAGQATVKLIQAGVHILQC